MIAKVSELDSERVVELHPEDMLGLGIPEGSVLKIKGRRTCHALASIAGQEQLKRGEIGIGSQLQSRLGIVTGTEVKVAKASLPVAERVQFIASTSGMPGENISFMMKDESEQKKLTASIKLALNSLAHIPLRKGDSLRITPLEISKSGYAAVTPILAPELQRVVMESTVYIKIVDTAPAGEVVCGPDSEWCEADLKAFMQGNKEISFDMVGGLKSVKDQLRQAVEGPILHAEQYKKWKVRPTKGILLFGPPGCGKTMLAKAVARELEAELIYIRGAEIYNCYFGVSEAMVREIFNYARTFSRAVIFWDEFDAVGTARNTAGQNSRLFDTILNSLLVEMDGMSSNDNVILIAATNRLDQLDPALTRPGRFDFTVRVPLPTDLERQEILSIYLKDKAGAEKIDVKALAVQTAGYTGADLENVIRIACLEMIETRDSETLDSHHIETALARSRPSLTKEQVEYYEKMINQKGNPDVKKGTMYG